MVSLYRLLSIQNALSSVKWNAYKVVVQTKKEDSITNFTANSMQNFRPEQRIIRKGKAFKNAYFLLPTCVLFLLAVKSFHHGNAMICIDQQPKFQMQNNSKIVSSILLPVENMQNKHVRIAPFIKRFNR